MPSERSTVPCSEFRSCTGCIDGGAGWFAGHGSRHAELGRDPRASFATRHVVGLRSPMLTESTRVHESGQDAPAINHQAPPRTASIALRTGYFDTAAIGTTVTGPSPVARMPASILGAIAHHHHGHAVEQQILLGHAHEFGRAHGLHGARDPALAASNDRVPAARRPTRRASRSLPQTGAADRGLTPMARRVRQVIAVPPAAPRVPLIAGLSSAASPRRRRCASTSASAWARRPPPIGGASRSRRDGGRGPPRDSP